MSAIDWLKRTPTVTLDIGQGAGPPVTDSAALPQIGVEPLDAPGREAVGLLPTSVTGLPITLWQASPASLLADLVTDLRPEMLPAGQALLYTLLLAEANPPSATVETNALLHARVDKLVESGALEQANALLERAGPETPDLFRRWFDATLLLGQEVRACKSLDARPDLAPSYAARVFCTARGGDWAAAALTLDTANILGLVTEEEDALLLRFLDPEFDAGEPVLVAQSEMTPLKFRLWEAIGEPQPTGSLPRAYAHADLRATAGWKAQLEAAERLARTGALPGNRLLGIYTDRRPAASGMIWDRVAAVQAFDAALEAGDAARISETLPKAWSAMREADLEVPFAELYGGRLLGFSVDGVSGTLIRDIALLSPVYERAAQNGPRDFKAMLAAGTPPRIPSDPTERAIADAFNGAGVPQALSTQLVLGRLGEVILRAMLLLDDGAEGDLQSLTDGLATLRAVGLEDTARRAALQVLLLSADR